MDDEFRPIADIIFPMQFRTVFDHLAFTKLVAMLVVPAIGGGLLGLLPASSLRRRLAVGWCFAPLLAVTAWALTQAIALNGATFSQIISDLPGVAVILAVLAIFYLSPWFALSLITYNLVRRLREIHRWEL